MKPRQKSLMKQELRIVETNTKDKLDNDIYIKNIIYTMNDDFSELILFFKISTVPLSNQMSIDGVNPLGTFLKAIP